MKEKLNHRNHLLELNLAARNHYELAIKIQLGRVEDVSSKKLEKKLHKAKAHAEAVGYDQETIQQQIIIGRLGAALQEGNNEITKSLLDELVVRVNGGLQDWSDKNVGVDIAEEVPLKTS